MARTRERQCLYYEYEGCCKKGRSGEFRGQCQTCNKYVPKPGAAPARTDNRRKKLDRIDKRERKEW